MRGEQEIWVLHGAGRIQYHICAAVHWGVHVVTLRRGALVGGEIDGHLDMVLGWLMILRAVIAIQDSLEVYWSAVDITLQGVREVEHLVDGAADVRAPGEGGLWAQAVEVEDGVHVEKGLPFPCGVLLRDLRGSLLLGRGCFIRTGGLKQAIMSVNIGVCWQRRGCIHGQNVVQGLHSPLKKDPCSRVLARMAGYKCLLGSLGQGQRIDRMQRGRGYVGDVLSQVRAEAAGWG